MFILTRSSLVYFRRQSPNTSLLGEYRGTIALADIVDVFSEIRPVFAGEAGNHHAVSTTIQEKCRSKDNDVHLTSLQQHSSALGSPRMSMDLHHYGNKHNNRHETLKGGSSSDSDLATESDNSEEEKQNKQRDQNNHLLKVTDGGDDDMLDASMRGVCPVSKTCRSNDELNELDSSQQTSTCKKVENPKRKMLQPCDNVIYLQSSSRLLVLRLTSTQQVS